MVNVLVGVSGSVATVKLPMLVNQLKCNLPSADVQVVCTQHSTHFFDVEDVDAKVRN